MIPAVNNANAHDFRAMDQQRSSAFDNAIAHAIAQWGQLVFPGRPIAFDIIAQTCLETATCVSRQNFGPSQTACANPHAAEQCERRQQR